MPRQSEKPKSFEQSMQELEQIVAAMESSDLPLERALEHYERGIRLIQQCENTLEHAEHTVRMLEADRLKPVTPPDDEAGT